MGDSFNPEVLIVARESRKETQTSLAKATGVTQGLISKIENDLHEPTPEQVQKIADYLRYPPELFYESGPILEGKSGCLYHRKRKTLPAKVLDALDGIMGVRLINARRMLHGVEVATERSFHMLDPDEFGGPEKVADRLRMAWRVAEGPIRDLTALIESAGGMIVLTSFGTNKLFGMSQWTTHDLPLFFLNADSPPEDLRWTLAHELGHLIMHATPSARDPEKEADAFAGEFLAPARLIAPQLRGLTFDRLPALKMQWRIPMKALIKRAEVIGAISRQDAVRLYKRYSAHRWHNAEPYRLPPEPPTLLRTAAQVHLEQHEYSWGELARAVRLYEPELRSELLGDDEGPRRLSLVTT